MNIKSNKLKDDAPHILIIDDDERILELLCQYMFEQGFRITTAKDAKTARHKLKSLMFDMLIVDVMMPGESGNEFTQKLRKQTDIPILMLTALGEVEARVQGLEAGADDYLAKPFEPKELVLRVKAILKRAKQPDPPLTDSINFGPYIFSLLSKELKKDGIEIRLTEKEKDILYLFAQKPSDVISRQELAGYIIKDNTRNIDVQINRLREKIEKNKAQPKWLQTVRGRGYRLMTDK